MPIPSPTVDELIQTLARSQLSTLITEGVYDHGVLRRIEERFGSLDLDIISTGGRGALLEIFDRRNEIGNQNRFAFLADRDCWVFDTPPQAYDHELLLLTDGYAIENDLYRDGNLERLLTPEERVRFELAKQSFLAWYSYAVSRHLVDGETSISNTPHEVLDGESIDPAFAQRFGYSEPDAQIYDKIAIDYCRLLRGKSLVALLLYFLSAADRHPKHSRAQLLEIAAVANGPHMERLCEAIRARFSD